MALATLGNESSESIRAQVYKGSLRLVLAERASTISGCCKQITDLLRLHSPLPPDAVLPHLESLIADGEVAQEAGIYSLTHQGRVQVDAQQSNAFANLARGRQAIREQIEASIGYRLSDTHFKQIWKIIQEKLAHFFFLRGQEMVLAVSRLIERKDVTDVDYSRTAVLHLQHAPHS